MKQSKSSDAFFDMRFNNALNDYYHYLEIFQNQCLRTKTYKLNSINMFNKQ